MTLPTYIDIGPTRVQVSENVSDLEAMERRLARAIHGACSFADGLIIVREGLADDTKKIVLLHEILHMCFAVFGHDTLFENSEEEDKVVDAVVAPLLDTLKRNPPLVHYLLNDDDRDTEAGS